MSFNSTKVQLGESVQRFMTPVISSFNSTKVQLGVKILQILNSNTWF